MPPEPNPPHHPDGRPLDARGPGTGLVEHFFDGTGPTYDHIVNLTTFGLDRRWKRHILDQIPTGSKRILDQACGTGILTVLIRERFPEASVTGVELRDEYLEIARRKTEALGITDMEWLLGRAEDIILPPGLDCIVSSYLAKYADLPVLVANAQAMLRPGGVLAMHDFAPTAGRSLGGLGALYFKLLRAWARWRYPAWEVIFRELPILMERTRWPELLIEALRRQGFTDIRQRILPGGLAAMVTARR